MFSMNSTVERGTGKLYVEYVSVATCLMFSHEYTGVESFGRKTTKVKCHFHRVISRVPNINIIFECGSRP